MLDLNLHDEEIIFFALSVAFFGRTYDIEALWNRSTAKKAFGCEGFRSIKIAQFA